MYPFTHHDDFLDPPLDPNSLIHPYKPTPILIISLIHPCTHLDDLLEVVVLLFPAVQGHELCLVVVPHPGHALLTDGAVVALTDVLMVHHPSLDTDTIKSKS